MYCWWWKSFSRFILLRKALSPDIDNLQKIFKVQFICGSRQELDAWLFSCFFSGYRIFTRFVFWSVGCDVLACSVCLFVCLFVCFAVLGFELRAYTFSHSTSPFFVMGFFWERISQVICPGWLQTAILLITTSWVARIYRPEPLAPYLLGCSERLQKRVSFCFHSNIIKYPQGWPSNTGCQI
jgi:hypothetical protein